MKKTQIASAVALLSMAFTSVEALARAEPAVAQVDSLPQAKSETSEAQSERLGAVLVTARRSVSTAPEVLKKDAINIVDSLSADNIEKTGDLNIAESLERVAGVSSQSFFGAAEAGYVAIRGFGSRYNSIDIDGNAIYISSQNNRGTQISMIPSAIVNEVGVYKTVLASQDANSLGGHIGLRTLRAFDGGSKSFYKIGGSLGEYQQKSTTKSGPSGRLYGAGKFTFGPSNQFGFVFGANFQRNNSADLYGGADGYTQVNSQDQSNGNIYDKSYYERNITNTSLYAKLEARESDKYYSFLSFNLFDEHRAMYLQRAGTFVAATSPRTITQTGSETANFTGGEGQVREYDYEMKRRAKMLGTGLDYHLIKDGVLALRAGYTDYDNETLTRNTGGGFRLSSVNGSYDLNGDTPTLNFSDPARYANTTLWVFNNAASSGTSGAYQRTWPLHDKITTASANFNYNNHPGAEGIGATVGADYSRLDRSFDQTQTFYSFPTANPALTLAQVFGIGSSMANNAAIRSNWNSFYDYLLAKGIARTDQAPSADYTLNESVAAFHATLSFAGSNYGVYAGVRNENTVDKIGTSNIVKNVPTAVHPENRYNNWLPNLQGYYDFTDRLKFRAAYTKTLARPDFQDFAPGQTNGVDANGVPLNSGSNPQLGPRLSTNYDLAVEYYGQGNILALSLFQKDVTNETFSQRTEVRDTAGQLLAVNTVPLNSGSAKLKGIELTYGKDRLTFLPGILGNFGVSGNYTRLLGEWNVVFSDGSTRTVGGLREQPKWLGNIQLRYSDGPFESNLNYKKIGRTFTGTFGTTAVGDRWIEATNTLDWQLNWKFNSKLRMSFDMKNLTSSFIKQTTGINSSVYNSVGAGRSFFLGLHFKS